VTPQRPGVTRRVEARPSRSSDPTGYAATFDPHGVTLRPLRARREEAAIYATWDQVYQMGLLKRVPKTPRRKRARK
jgi:hypothetical protein